MTDRHDYTFEIRCAETGAVLIQIDTELELQLDFDAYGEPKIYVDAVIIDRCNITNSDNPVFKAIVGQIIDEIERDDELLAELAGTHGLYCHTSPPDGPSTWVRS